MADAATATAAAASGALGWLSSNGDGITALHLVVTSVFGMVAWAGGWISRKLREPAEQRQLREQVTRTRSRLGGLGRAAQLAFEKNEAVLKAVKPNGSGTSPLPQYAALDTPVQRAWDSGDGLVAVVAQHIFDTEPRTPEGMEAYIKANGYGGALARELRNCARQGAQAQPPTKPWWRRW